MTTSMESAPYTAFIEKTERLLKSGNVFEAHNRIMQWYPDHSQDLRLNQLFALALVRLGAHERAIAVIEPFYQSGYDDPETAGIMGRIHKDLWKRSADPEMALRSRDIYLDSYEKTGDPYPGINAAAMSLVVEDHKMVQALAGSILEKTATSADYWGLATAGEAALLLGELDQAANHYREAATLAGVDYGSLASSFKQLQFLGNYLEVPEEIVSLLRPPPVLVFVGNMIDAPDRATPRFTEEMVEDVRKRIHEELLQLGSRISYSSAACGTDLIFLEEMSALDGETNVVLPFHIEDFFLISVSYAGDIWEKRFHDALSTSNLTFITEEKHMGSDDLFAFTNIIITGMAYLRAHLMHTEAYLLAVADSTEKAAKPGGTLELIHSWKDPDTIQVVDISEIRQKHSFTEKSTRAGSAPNVGKGVRAVEEGAEESTNKAAEEESPENATEKGAGESGPEGIVRRIKCILFADIVGFSKIPEEDTPHLLHDLLTELGELLRSVPVQPEIINTWGDAIFAVFDTAEDAMQYALTLLEAFEKKDWSRTNLPDHINIRIALHTGPIFLTDDSITGRPNAYGAHINRTARMEPITIPGAIFTSLPFAARLIYESGEKYSYEYTGFLVLPKGFGKQEMFRISRAKEIAI